MIQQLLSQPPTPLSQAAKGLKFPPGLEAAVMKGLSRAPADRQPTMTAFAAELEAGLGDGAGAGARKGWLGALKHLVGKRQ